MPKTILVVDDEPEILKVIAFRLKKAGYGVLTASDGEAAIDWVKNTMPDLVLLDIALPLIDGYEVCKNIKSNERTKKIPVIFSTASSTIGDIEDKSKECMADGYLVKPFTPEQLLEKIKTFI